MTFEPISGGVPTPEEAAAIAAAIEQFLRDTAPPPAPEAPISAWTRAARHEGVQRDPQRETWG